MVPGMEMEMETGMEMEMGMEMGMEMVMGMETVIVMAGVSLELLHTESFEVDASEE